MMRSSHWDDTVISLVSIGQTTEMTDKKRYFDRLFHGESAVKLPLVFPFILYVFDCQRVMKNDQKSLFSSQLLLCLWKSPPRGRKNISYVDKTSYAEGNILWLFPLFYGWMGDTTAFGEWVTLNLFLTSSMRHPESRISFWKIVTYRL